MKFRLFRQLSLALPLLLASMGAHAVPIKTALGIVIDGSGSISSANFAIQLDAYAAVIGDASIVMADGSVVLNIIQFAASRVFEQTAIRLNSEADRTIVLNAINEMSQIFGGTNIENHGSINIFRKLGFSEEGISKESHFRNGKYYDLIKFGLLNKNDIK
jgi:hypothetical protein